MNVAKAVSIIIKSVILELDDFIATASEKTPTNDENIQELRSAIQLIKKEYEEVLSLEETNVRESANVWPIFYTSPGVNNCISY